MVRELVAYGRIITNMATGNSEQTQYLVECGAMEVLLRFLRDENLEVAEQALWGIGNIAGDNSVYRDILISKGCIQTICKLDTRDLPHKTVHVVAWVLSNLVRGKPLVKYQHIKQITPYLLALLRGSTLPEIVSDILWGFSYVTVNPHPSCIEDVVRLGLVQVTQSR